MQRNRAIGTRSGLLRLEYADLRHDILFNVLILLSPIRSHCSGLDAFWQAVMSLGSMQMSCTVKTDGTLYSRQKAVGKSRDFLSTTKTCHGQFQVNGFAPVNPGGNVVYGKCEMPSTAQSRTCAHHIELFRNTRTAAPSHFARCEPVQISPIF